MYSGRHFTLHRGGQVYLSQRLVCALKGESFEIAVTTVTLICIKQDILGGCKVEKILNQFIDKLDLPWKFEVDNKFQISRGD